MNSDIIFTDTQRAEDQTKVRKRMGRRIKPRMNRKELIKLANDEIAEWENFLVQLNKKNDNQN